jgi:hypothetical protein
LTANAHGKWSNSHVKKSINFWLSIKVHTNTSKININYFEYEEYVGPALNDVDGLQAVGSGLDARCLRRERKPRDAVGKRSATHSWLSHAACPIEILCETLWWITAIMSLRVL